VRAVVAQRRDPETKDRRMDGSGAIGTIPLDWAGHAPGAAPAAADAASPPAPGGNQLVPAPGGNEVVPAPGGDAVVPAPRAAGDAAAPGRPVSQLARMALARVRARNAVPLDVVTFASACPACGADCTWTQERQDTRVRSTIGCSCPC
jgi:hypothetical protein